MVQIRSGDGREVASLHGDGRRKSWLVIDAAMRAFLFRFTTYEVVVDRTQEHSS